MVVHQQVVAVFQADEIHSGIGVREFRIHTLRPRPAAVGRPRDAQVAMVHSTVDDDQRPFLRETDGRMNVAADRIADADQSLGLRGARATAHRDNCEPRARENRVASGAEGVTGRRRASGRAGA